MKIKLTLSAFLTLLPALPAVAQTLAVGGAPGAPAGGTLPVGTPGLNTAASCEPTWASGFGSKPGLDAYFGLHVPALAVFDDGSGSGPGLYVGGNLEFAGGMEAQRIARWDGTAWSTLGSGLDLSVASMTAFDDGGGPALIVGGYFTSAGGVPANRIAKWDGTSWSALGSGIDGGVLVLAVFDDGTGGGPALFAAGAFSSAGGVPASRIAKWDGTSWSALGSGLNDTVHCMAVYDDGTGPALYVGGPFTSAGGAPAAYIAKWDGASWSPLGTGMNSHVSTMAVYDDGTGAALYAGGYFTTAGGAPGARLARWDGTSWSEVGGGVNAQVRTLAVFDDGSGGGPALVVGGSFSSVGGMQANRLAKWNGTSWTALGYQHMGIVIALAVFDEGGGQGEMLYMCGTTYLPDQTPAHHMARYDGSTWSTLGDGLDDEVLVMTEFDDGAGSGQALYVAGAFQAAGGALARRIARWDGTSWSPLGSGLSHPVHALAVFDDGSGPVLYVGGEFRLAGGVTVDGIAKWNGASWSAVGGGMSGSAYIGHTVQALAVFDDGSGPALYAAGRFDLAGGVPVNRIARWDGTSWSGLGSGLDSTGMVLAVFDDGAGSGPALYVGGYFSTAGGVSASRIAKWDGASWHALGSGVNGSVHSLAVHDDGMGGGPALYVGGTFSSAGGQSANRIARWNGASWRALGEGTWNNSLAVYDDGTGSGAALYAGRSSDIAKWDGVSWSALDGTFTNNDPNEFSPWVSVLAVHDDGSGAGPRLYAGGNFQSPSNSSYITAWGGCAHAGLGAVYCAGAASCPCANSGGPGEGCANSSGMGALLTGTGSASVSADDLVISSSQLPSGRPALLFAGTLAIAGGVAGDGLLCTSGSVVRLSVQHSDSNGVASWGPGILGEIGFAAAGQTAHFQVWYRDIAASPCGSGYNLSSGLAIDLVP